MKEKKVLILGIEYKVRKLLDQLNKLKGDHQQVVEESQDLKRIIEEKNILIASLKEEIQKVKLAKSLEHLEGSNDAKMKINELVRGIDKCIGLLNQ
jgi:chromosome segregation ATPase